MNQAKRKDISELPLNRRILKNAIEISVICFSATAIFLLIALLDFYPEDPAWSHSSSSNIIQNKTGYVGAWLADILLYLFGYLGYLFPFVMAYGGWKILQAIRNKTTIDAGNCAIRFISFIMVLICSCGLAWLYFYVGDGLPWASGGAGGVLGDAIGTNLFEIFGEIGSTLVLLTILLVGISLLTDLSWIWLMDVIGNRFFRLLDVLVGLWELRHDHKLGKQAKREREVVLKVEKEKMESREPVRIEPNISEFSISDRQEEVKQANLFDPPAQIALPPLDLLAEAPESEQQYSRESLEVLSRQIELKLQDFGVDAQVVGVLPGPVVTRFEIQLAAGVKSSRVMNLTKDMARSLSVVSVRVVDIIPGKSVIGLEFPNERRQIVVLRDILKSKEYHEMDSSLTIALGKDISGQPVVADLAKMPHLLVAGTTGSGKSVALNVMILSLLFKATAKDIRLIMIDPKMLELSVYEGIQHLLSPVVTDMKDAANALRWCVAEMDRRYKLMAEVGVRNINGYRQKLQQENNTVAMVTESSEQVGEDGNSDSSLEYMPFIVIVIDELADLIMITGKKIEELIARLAQKARAAGIHLILATQRPSVDVITGLIKANIPSRIAFQVSSKIDSRTILDQGGAETLLGHGDMLYLPSGSSMPKRIHGAFVDDHEIYAAVEHIKSLGDPDYDDDVLNFCDEANMSTFSSDSTAASDLDPLYDEAVRIVTETRKASISYTQRRLRIGYNRAARIIEEMESSGLVSTTNATGQREVLAPPPPVVD